MARNILLVDPEQLVRNLLGRALLQDKECDQIFEADSFSDALHILSRESISVVITEIVIKGSSGFDLVQKVTKSYACPCIVLTGLEADELEHRGLSAGAIGVVHKTSPFVNLRTVLQRTRTASVNGKESLPQARSGRASSSENKGNYSSIASSLSDNSDPLNALTPREKEVFHLLTVGMKNVEIAKQLYISTRTVETHRARLSKKLKINSSIDLLRYAMKHGLTQL